MRTFGVEEEFLVFTQSGDEVVSRGGEIVAEAESTVPPDAQVDQELTQEQAETGSAPATSMAELRQQLALSRQNLAQAAARKGLAVAALGTSPLTGPAHIAEQDRYQAMLERYAIVASEQLTCGQHVHVSVDSREEGIAVIDRLQPWLSTVRALSANSPFWRGSDTGYSSYRTICWGQWPTSGPTEQFGSVENYERVVADLIATGAALDEGMIYFDCRLSAHYPTVEIRVADVCTDLDDALLLAVVCRALVETVGADAAQGNAENVRSHWMLRAAQWRAARFGLQDSLLGAEQMMPAAYAVRELQAYIRPALVHSGEDAFVESGFTRLLADGSGAARQRATFARTGDLRDVVREACSLTARA
jgi:carboxylate-amine ligase